MIQYKNGDWKSFTIKQLWKGKLLMQKFGTEKFHGVNFAVFPHKGVLGSGEARKSMEEMAHKTHANWVILTPSGMQETPYSEEIHFDGEKSCTDEELCDMIRYAQSLGLKVALKPTVNCDNGVWRARISFLIMMFPVNRSGATGLKAILLFRSIMHRSHSGQGVNYFLQAAR